MLKWYLRIYIFIEYLKCVWKVIIFGLFEMIQKKKRIRTTSLGPGSASRLGTADGPSHFSGIRA